MWSTLKEMYFNEQNISHIAYMFEKLFSLRQDDCSLSDY